MMQKVSMHFALFVQGSATCDVAYKSRRRDVAARDQVFSVRYFNSPLSWKLKSALDIFEWNVSICVAV